MPRPGNNILYHPLVVSRDIPSLDSVSKKRICKTIEEKLSLSPEIYGVPLRGTLKKYWKLRVGDFRIVYTIEKGLVIILVIANRKEVYKTAGKRI